MNAGKVDEKATQLHAIASLKVLLDATKPQDNGGPAGANGTVGGHGGSGDPDKAGFDPANDSGRASQGTEVRQTPFQLLLITTASYIQFDICPTSLWPSSLCHCPKTLISAIFIDLGQKP